MRNTFFAIAITSIAFAFASCNNHSSQEANRLKESSKSAAAQLSSFTSPVKGILQIYLEMKNAFVNDDDRGAAKAGNTMVKALNDFDTISLKEEERKTFRDISDDMKENAEHIGNNAGNIKHQREHFDILSRDMYDMVKAFSAGEKIYVDDCPMYNDNRGAIWLSETKEIRNPYFGKGMDICGSIKEELK